MRLPPIYDVERLARSALELDGETSASLRLLQETFPAKSALLNEPTLTAQPDSLSRSGLMLTGDLEGKRADTVAHRSYRATESQGSDHAERGVPGEARSTLLDQSGRPTVDGNRERVAASHQALSAHELQAQRQALEDDLASNKGSETQSVLEKLKSSALSPTQQDRVLNVFAEIRSSYLKAGESGAPPAEELNSYRHTIGELSEGLDSAARRGLDARTTQNSLLAAMLSDAHKYGWSRATGGNFFTHHLDGALAAETILSRYTADATKATTGGAETARGAADIFNSQDVEAVRHADLEHQVQPKDFMGKAYAGEIRAGMARAGVSPSEQDAQNIEHIRQLMSDPLNAPVERDELGGYRVAFSPAQRELLRQYVGEGTQNWHVPNSANSWNGVSQGVLASDGFDNYFPRVGTDGQPITGPFKIASLRGPRALPPDLSLSQSVSNIDETARSTLEVFTGADREVAAQRLAQSGRIYDQAMAGTESWLRGRLGLPADAPIPPDTPYWSRPIQPPPTGGDQAEILAWRQNPDTKLADDIQQHFAEELYTMRLRV